MPNVSYNSVEYWEAILLCALETHDPFAILYAHQLVFESDLLRDPFIENDAIIAISRNSTDM